MSSGNWSSVSRCEAKQVAFQAADDRAEMTDRLLVGNVIGDPGGPDAERRQRGVEFGVAILGMGHPPQACRAASCQAATTSGTGRSSCIAAR